MKWKGRSTSVKLAELSGTANAEIRLNGRTERSRFECCGPYLGDVEDVDAV